LRKVSYLVDSKIKKNMGEEEKIYVTKEKLEELKTELKTLKTVKRREVADTLEYAKSLGDLSENAEYSEAREEQAKLENRINRLEFVTKNAVIMEPTKGSIAGIGSTVVVKKDGSNDPRTFTIVGSEDSNTTEGKISDQSPLGGAIIGKKAEDDFVVRTPSGEVPYKIIEVR
jgi:transcription elongation factor GreA